MSMAPISSYVSAGCYLIVNENGRVRATKNPPALEIDEVAIKLDLVLPSSLFVRPRFQATVKVSEDAVRTQVIAPEVLVQTKDLIEQQTGLRIDLKAVPVDGGQ